MDRDDADALVGKEAFVDGIPYHVDGVRRGGMGTVFLLSRPADSTIEAPIYRARLAAKVFNDAEDSETQALIKRELKNWLSLRHQNVLELLAIGDFNFELAALMPLALTSLADQAIGKTPMPLLAAIQTIRDAAAGLEYAWSTKRILHLDVKPENMLILKKDGHYVLKVSDWGLSHVQSAKQSGGFGGTPPYMAPERFFRGAQASCSWDIFSLGIALIVCISGRLPLDLRADVPEQMISGAYRSKAASLLVAAGLNVPARRAALFSIHPDPDRRIANYQDFTLALETVARNPRFNLPWTKKTPWT
jgi:serine/threonine protein kinase